MPDQPFETFLTSDSLSSPRGQKSFKSLIRHKFPLLRTTPSLIKRPIIQKPSHTSSSKHHVLRWNTLHEEILYTCILVDTSLWKTSTQVFLIFNLFLQKGQNGSELRAWERAINTARKKSIVMVSQVQVTILRGLFLVCWQKQLNTASRYNFLIKSSTRVRFAKRHVQVSMTQLLSHTFAHLTGSSFRLKAKLLPNKKILGLKYTWVNSVKKWPSF